MNKKKITLDELRQALMRTFESYSWDTTDYDVWCGIYHFYAERLWRALDKEELEKSGKLQKYPKKYKHIFGKYYKLIEQK